MRIVLYSHWFVPFINRIGIRYFQNYRTQGAPAGEGWKNVFASYYFVIYIRYSIIHISLFLYIYFLILISVTTTTTTGPRQEQETVNVRNTAYYDIIMILCVVAQCSVVYTVMNTIW